MPGVIDDDQQRHRGLSLTPHSFGGSVSSFAPVVSLDERLLFCCVGNDVKVVSIATGETVRLLQSHADIVTSLAVHPRNPLQIFSGSHDGTILVWDVSDGTVVNTFSVGMPVHFVLIPRALDRLLFVSHGLSTSAKGNKVDTSVIMEIPLQPSQTPIPDKLLQLNRVSAIVLSNQDTYLAAISRKRLFLYHLGSTSDRALRIFTFQNPLTAVAINDESASVAVGDKSGVISQLFCLHDPTLTQEQCAVTTMHWHAHRVEALAFSSTGDYLLSGGEEAVLVIWQLATRQKNFLPRLSAAITGLAVSPKNTYYCASHDDSSVHIINALNLQVKATVQGVKLVGLAGTSSSINTGLVFEPRHNALVLNSTPGCLQFYHPIQDRHITEVEVVSRNRVNRGNKSQIGSAIIDHVAFSPTGTWMATVDRMEDSETVAVESSTLRFWRLDETSQHYVENTRVDQPHGMHEVSALRFHSSGAMVVTAGLDRRFRLWRLTSSHERGTTDRLTWTCQSVGYFREYMPNDAALSADGSLLAIAHAHMITLWDPLTTQLQQTLCHPPPDSPIVGLEFVHPHFLVAFTKSHLYVWNLLTCTVWWMLEMTVMCLAVDPAPSRFAVIVRRTLTRHERRQKKHKSRKTIPSASSDAEPVVSAPRKSGCEIIIFAPASPVPLLRHVHEESIFTALAFVPEAKSAPAGNPPTVHLVATDGHSRFLRYESESTDTAMELPGAGTEALDPVPMGRLSALFGNLRTSTMAKEEKTAALTTQAIVNPQTMPSVLTAPAHTIPSVHRIFRAFMEDLLIANPDLLPALDASRTPMASAAGDTNADTAADMDVDAPSSLPIQSQHSRNGVKRANDIAADHNILAEDYSFLLESLQPQTSSKKR